MLVCQFTKWIEAYPLPNQKAESVAKATVNNFISRFGCPSQIHTDQGSNFTSSLFQAICDLLNIAKTRTTPYHPSSNGQVERYNCTILQMMRCHLKGNNTKWDEDLPIRTGAIRALPNRTTGFTPNLMMLGREVRQPLDLVFDIKTIPSKQPGEYVTELEERINTLHSLARKTIGGSQNYQKKYYDNTKNQTAFEEGDVVYKLNKGHKAGHSTKLQPIWKGPFLVTEALSPLLYRIKGKKTSSVVHHDLIKKCEDREFPFWLRRQRSQLLGSGSQEKQQDHSENLEIESLFSSNSEYQADKTTSTRSGRITKLPSHLANYHTY